MYFLKKYPLTLIVIGAVLFLSFFNPPETPLDNVTNIDKLVHFLMYTSLCCIIWFEYFRCHRKQNKKKLFWGAIIAPVIFSGLIEIGQETLTTNRGGDWWDFLFNSLGVLTASLIGCTVIRPCIRRYQRKKEESSTRP